MSASPAVVFPPTPADAIAELGCGDDETVRPLAGGTALALLARYGFLRPTRLVSLRSVAGMGGISSPRPGVLDIGALVTLTGVARSALVARAAGALAAAAGVVANVRIRNVASVGGHLAHADPHMDLPPLLLALDARVVILGPAGSRSAAVSDLITGYYQTTLGQQELITSVEVPIPPARVAVYRRYASAAAGDWPSVAVAAAMQARNGHVADPRIAVGAVTPAPTRLAAAEQALAGVPLGDPARQEAACAEAAQAAADAVDPSSDQHGSAAYQRELVRVQVRRALARLFDQQAAKGSP